MEIGEARQYAGQRVSLTWTDRKGDALTQVVDVFEVNFVPFYGPCMITSEGEIRLDRIVSCELSELRKAG